MRILTARLEFVDGAGEPSVEIGEEAQRRRDFRGGEDANAFDVIVELLLRQRSNDRRDGREGAVNAFFRIKNVDFELDFLVDRRRVDEKSPGNAERGCEPLRNFAQLRIRPPGEPRVKGRFLGNAELKNALEEAALRAEKGEQKPASVASASVGGGKGRVFVAKIVEIGEIVKPDFGGRRRVCRSRKAEKIGGDFRVGKAAKMGDQTFRRDVLRDQIDGALEHNGRRTGRVVPINLAEHDVSGENHQLGGRFSLRRDRDSVAAFVEANAPDEPLDVVIFAVRDARRAAVAEEVIGLVDVDRAGKDAREEAKNDDAAGKFGVGVGRTALRRIFAQDGANVGGIDAPIGANRRGQLAEQVRGGGLLVRDKSRQFKVFEEVAKGEMTDVVEERGEDQRFGFLRSNERGEPFVVREAFQY